MTFAVLVLSGAGRVRLADPRAGVTPDLSGGPWRLRARRRAADRAQRGHRDRRIGPGNQGRVVDLADCLAAAAGGFLGDTGSYVLGRTAGAAAARRLFRSPKAKGRLTWAGGALDRHGATIIMVARFIPGARTATTFTAGTVRLAWPRFAAADAVGATLWAMYAAGLGYLGGETFGRRPLYAFLFGLGVALLVALAVEAARRLRRRGDRPGDRGALGGRPRR